MNVLKRMIIPGLTMTIHYILSELEELEREEKFRLKRVKEKQERKKSIEDGAGEQIEDSSVKKDKEVKDEKMEVKLEELKPESGKESLTVQPKEVAGVGDLIVIKLPDDRLEEGDSFIPPSGLKTMATFPIVEELIDENNFDKENMNMAEEITEIKKLGHVMNEYTHLGTEKKEETEENKFKNTKVENINSDTSDKKIAKEKSIESDVKNENNDLETGEWFETTSMVVNRQLNEQTSEYSRMDKFEDIIGERMTDEASAGRIPLKADESITDIDKRAQASLFRGIDFNYYQPTIDDIFSKHDIAMQDSLSMQDISLIDHSLVDLESIDFSIDSKGKVVFSKLSTETSLLGFSTYHGANVSKSRYDGESTVLHPTSRLQSLRWSAGNNETTEQTQLDNKFEEPVKVNTENVKAEKDNIIEETKDEKTDELLIKPRKNSLDSEKIVDNSQEFKSRSSKTDTNHDHLKNKSTISLEETEVWTSDTESIQNKKVTDELKTEQARNSDNAQIIVSNVPKSISDEKLSRISEVNETSEANTLAEEPQDQSKNEKDADSIVSNKFEDSKSSFHGDEKLSTTKKNKSQSVVPVNKSMNGISLLEIEEHEALIAENIEKAFETANPEIFQEVDDTKEDELKPDTSAKSIQDILRSKEQNKAGIKSVDEVKQSIKVVEERPMTLSEEVLQTYKYELEDVSESNHETGNLTSFEPLVIGRVQKDTGLRDKDKPDSRQVAESIDEIKPLLIKDDIDIKTERKRGNDSNEIGQKRQSRDKSKSEAKDDEKSEINQSIKDLQAKVLHDENKALKIQDSNDIQTELERKSESKTGETKKDSQDIQQGTENKKSIDKAKQAKRTSQVELESKTKETALDEPKSHDSIDIKAEDKIHGRSSERKDSASSRTKTESQDMHKSEIEHSNSATVGKKIRNSQDKHQSETKVKVEGIRNETNGIELDIANKRGSRDIQETRDSLSNKAKRDSLNTKKKEAKHSKLGDTKEDSKDKRKSETIDTMNKRKSETKDTINQYSKNSLDIDNKGIKLRDSTDIIKVKKGCKGKQKTTSEQAKDTLKITERRDKNTDHDENKPLKIQNSRDNIKLDQEDKITEDRQGKSSKKDRNEQMEKEVKENNIINTDLLDDNKQGSSKNDERDKNEKEMEKEEKEEKNRKDDKSDSDGDSPDNVPVQKPSSHLKQD